MDASRADTDGGRAALKAAYGVVWREGGVEQRGRLKLGPASMRLSSLADDASILREVPFDLVDSVELHPAKAGSERSVLVVKAQGGTAIEIESVADAWMLAELAEKVFAHTIGSSARRERILVALKLKPGSRDAALELLRAGPPFELSETALGLHDVYLLEDEVLFLFETGARETTLEDAGRLWEAAGAWRELIADGVRLAEHPYSWTRPGPEPLHADHPGLGL